MDSTSLLLFLPQVSYFAFLSVMGTLLARLPPGHQAAQWVFTAPFIL